MSKLFFSIAIFGLLVWNFSSCTKDRVPVVEVLDCPDTISFATDVLPIMQDQCFSCHSPGNNTGYIFTDHASIANQTTAIIGAMRGDGYDLMPQGGPALPDSLIQKIRCWVQQGKLNN